MQKPEWFDWTLADGVCNTSDMSKDLSREIDRIIRDGAHALIAGRVHDVAGLIVAQLAHKFKFVPTKETQL